MSLLVWNVIVSFRERQLPNGPLRAGTLASVAMPGVVYLAFKRESASSADHKDGAEENKQPKSAKDSRL